MDIKYLLELDELARQEGRKYSRRRLLHTELKALDGRHFTGITGPRGAGKTVLLKQLLTEQERAFYISLDTAGGEDLFAIAKRLKEFLNIELLLLDEIHFQKNYQGELKKIFDFLDLKVVFTSSVALAMAQSAFDLSRRIKLLKLPLFSFREYVWFHTDTLLPPLSLEDIINQDWSADHLRYAYMFSDYLQGGLLPFSLEEPDPLSLLANILEKILQRDIPSIAPLLVDEISRIEKMLKFMGKSSVDGINYSSISRNIGITKYKAESYLNLLSQALVLHIVFPKGTNVLKEPKVLFSPPYRLLYKEYEDAIGGLREDFCVEMLFNSKNECHYLKSRRGSKTPDFLVTDRHGDVVLEVGGKGKGRSQFKGIKVDRKIILTHDDRTEGLYRPLYLLGYLY